MVDCHRLVVLHTNHGRVYFTLQIEGRNWNLRGYRVLLIDVGRIGTTTCNKLNILDPILDRVTTFERLQCF